MSFRRVDQLLAGFAVGDAVSQDARLLQGALRQCDCESELFAPPDSIAPRAAHLCRTLAEFQPAATDAVILHYSIASAADEAFGAARGRKVVRYHNITPADFLDGFDDELAARLRQARARLGPIAAGAHAVWADSDFNAREIRELGIGGVTVLPLLFSAARFATPTDARIRARFAVPLRSILFVGRLAPNKRVEDLILAFHWYYRAIDPHSRLILVGSDRSCPRYCAMLRLLAAGLDLANVCFEGFAAEEALATYYALADVFVCASAHEGYCLPLVEAIQHGVPVIAHETGGMPEALGGAGVLYAGLDAAGLGELIHAVCTDGGLRQEVLASQARRMAEIRGRDATAEVRERLAVLAATG